MNQEMENDRQVLTVERLERMTIKIYPDKRSPILGFGIEDEKRIFAFYLDGWVDVMELEQVGVELFKMALRAAFGGYAFEYLMTTHTSWVTKDEERLAIAYLDFLACQR